MSGRDFLTKNAKQSVRSRSRNSKPDAERPRLPSFDSVCQEVSKRMVGITRQAFDRALTLPPGSLVSAQPQKSSSQLTTPICPEPILIHIGTPSKAGGLDKSRELKMWSKFLLRVRKVQLANEAAKVAEQEAASMALSEQAAWETVWGVPT